jgi:hypothetical protein
MKGIVFGSEALKQILHTLTPNIRECKKLCIIPGHYASSEDSEDIDVIAVLITLR